MSEPGLDLNDVKASVLDGSAIPGAPREGGGLKIKKVSLGTSLRELKRRHELTITRKSKTFNFQLPVE
jgi:hypothetical protein